MSEENQPVRPPPEGTVAAISKLIMQVGGPLVPSLVKSWASRPTIIERSGNKRWHLAKQHDGTAFIQLHVEWWITNNTDRPLMLASVEVVRPRTKGSVLIRHPTAEIYGNYPVLPKSTVPMVTDFLVPARSRSWARTRWYDIEFVDHNGHRTRKRNVEFKPENRQRKQPTKLATEVVADISDPDERAIVSLLKEELTRYERNGRQYGGLGTVKMQIGDKKHDHIYQDSWSSDRRGEREDIVAANEETRVVSENGDTLVSYYNSLDDERKARVIEFLEARIDRDREYYGVTYLIVYVLWRLGKLTEALQLVRERYEYRPSLYDKIMRRSYVYRVLEKTQHFGYSDVPGLINGILRYEHRSLSDDELNAVERFASETTEHPFLIAQKITSIRALRVGH